MTVSQSTGNGIFPGAIAEAVEIAFVKTLAAICGEKPARQGDGQPSSAGPCVAGIISLIGDVPLSLSWVLPQATAKALAQKFTGFDIPFDSQDMGDVAGELVNVLAGEVVAQLDRRAIKTQMSLPTVARGNPLELMPERGHTVMHLDFRSSQGSFWVRLASGKPGQALGRLPGT